MFTTRRRFGAAIVLATALLAPLAPSPASAVDDPASTVLEACPIDGDHELIDSWGWRRSGGRRHQGIDIGAPRGTELYAVRDGWANFKWSNLGGRSVWLTTDDGDEFFYAHLDSFVGDDRRVTAGELIGHVGSTGNAGGPHLHFETHPNGSVENPFGHVVAACTTPPEPAPESVPHESVTEVDASNAVPARSAIEGFLNRLRRSNELSDLGVGEPTRVGHVTTARPI